MSKLNTRIRRLELDAEHRAIVEAALGGPTSNPRLERARAAAGDPARLRGIPVLGACAGAIPGTRPDRSLR